MSNGRLQLPREIKRTNYFTSQFLVEADFKDEQAYHVEMRRLHNRALHVWGVVDGLTVSKTGAREVTVSEGMAIDSQGREIVLPTAQKLQVGLDRSGDLFVVISYRQDDQNPDYVYKGTGLTDTKYTRAVEHWQLEVKDSAADDGSVIKLARIKVDANGLVGNPDNTVRRLAGSVIRRGSGSNDLYIAADGKVGIGTDSPITPLHVSSGQAKTFTSTEKPLQELATFSSNETAGSLSLKVRLKGDTNAANRYASLQVEDGSDKRPLVLQADGGNVGIGRNDPPAKLVVRASEPNVARSTPDLLFIVEDYRGNSLFSIDSEGRIVARSLSRLVQCRQAMIQTSDLFTGT